MAVVPMTLDFTNVMDLLQHASGVEPEELPSAEAWRRSKETGKSLNPKAIRTRARRKRVRGKPDGLTKEETEAFYRKPIDEWDMEELAHGKPRNSQNNFKGRKPTWVTAAVSEEMAKRFRAVVKDNMNVHTVKALEKLGELIESDERDERGKPIVPPSVQLQATQFLLEHVVGKPNQRIEADISVKLQSVLAQVMVNPSELATGNYLPGHFPGVTMELSSADDLRGNDDDDDLIPTEG